MVRVTWREEATVDLEQIEQFVARDSQTYSRVLVARIIDSTERLEEMPNSGRVVPEADDDSVREVIVGNYRVMYRVWPDEVEVVAVIHAARMVKQEDIPR